MQIKKVFNHGNPRWRVSTYVDGKRKQRFMKKRLDMLEIVRGEVLLETLIKLRQ